MKILIADHNGLYREGLKALLTRFDQIDTCFEVDSIDAINHTLSEEYGIGLLILDLDLVQGQGLSDIDSIKQRWPHLNIALLTNSQDIVTVRDAFSMGISGYLLKREGTAVLEQAFKLILAGGVYVSEKFICEPIIERDASDIDALTPRQQQVLELLSDGLSNKEIGRLLALAEGTVKAHVAALLKSIGVKNRTQAANWARDRKLA